MSEATMQPNLNQLIAAAAPVAAAPVAAAPVAAAPVAAAPVAAAPVAPVAAAPVAAAPVAAAPVAAAPVAAAPVAAAPVAAAPVAAAPVAAAPAQVYTPVAPVQPAAPAPVYTAPVATPAAPVNKTEALAQTIAAHVLTALTPSIESQIAACAALQVQMQRVESAIVAGNAGGRGTGRAKTGGGSASGGKTSTPTADKIKNSRLFFRFMYMQDENVRNENRQWNSTMKVDEETFKNTLLYDSKISSKAPDSQDRYSAEAFAIWAYFSTETAAAWKTKFGQWKAANTASGAPAPLVADPGVPAVTGAPAVAGANLATLLATANAPVAPGPAIDESPF